MSTKVFDAYSNYYNLLYKTKDYEGEVEYITKLLSRYNKKVDTILELGCGTGKHAIILAKKGFKVHGIDMSDKMLEHIKGDISFEKDDVRTYRTNRKFDAVISLFHVASYQTTNEDLLNYFKTAAEHLDKGGIFIFDCWWGPAVLSVKPEKRVKELEDENVKIIRHAVPVVHIEQNIVDVNYTINIEEKSSGKKEKLEETHRMRYLFKPEIELMINLANLRLIREEEWMSGDKLSENSWSACFIGEKI